MKIKTETETCPRCGRSAATNALSRKDNLTHICNSCGTDEAMLDLVGEEVWPRYPKILDQSPWPGAQ